MEKRKKEQNIFPLLYAQLAWLGTKSWPNHW